MVFTDDAACMSLLGVKNPSSKLVHWAMTIQELDLDIRHRSGKSNRVADAFSRNPVSITQVLIFQSVKSPNPRLLSPPEDDSSLSPDFMGEAEFDV